MSPAPRVSVLMPFLNTRPFIAEAIDSVLAQRGTEWELLLVDDGATDGTSDVARRYVERHQERIRLFEHPEHRSRGIGASHNVALAHARGEYIAVLDSDDVWLPYTLARRVMLLDQYSSAGMVYGNTQFWYSWSPGARSNRDYMPDLGVESHTLLLPPTLLPLFLERRVAVPCTCSILVRRALVERLGGFEESLRTYVDQAFYAKVALASPMVAVDECWARYRRHPRSSCTVAWSEGQSRERALAFLDWLERYLASMRMDLSDVRRGIDVMRSRFTQHMMQA